MTRRMQGHGEDVERELDAALIDAVFDRLELAQPAVDTGGLRAVYRAWCDHISFDNLQKLVGLREDRRPLPGDRAAEFFDNWLHDGTGATCWASSNALHDLLAYLGFDVTRLTAAMLDLPDPNLGPVRSRRVERWWKRRPRLRLRAHRL